MKTIDQQMKNRRDELAAMAMQATRSNSGLVRLVNRLAEEGDKSIGQIIALMSYRIADAMIKEGEK